MQRQGLVPVASTFNALASACVKGKQPERAMHVFQALQRQGVLPDLTTYSTVINAWEKGKQPDRALEVFR